MQCFFHRKNQTARISLQIPNMSKSKRQKPDQCALSSTARPPNIASDFSKPTNVAAARSVPPCASAPPVKGYLRPQTNTRNPFFIKILKKMGYCLFSMACMIAAFATLRAHMALAVDNSGYSGAGLRFSPFAPPSGPESGESERPEGSESRPDRSSALSASL